METKLAAKAVEVSLLVVGAVACAAGGWFANRLISKYEKGMVSGLVKRTWTRITPGKKEAVAPTVVVAEKV